MSDDATTGPPTDLPRCTPEEVGVDPAAVHALLDDVARRGIELHGLMVLRHGRVLAEGWWAPYTPERVHLLYSLSKSFTSTALGFAVAEGRLTLDDTVLQHFPELDDEVTDPRSRALRLRDVAAMASGHLDDMVARARALDPVHLVRGFLLLPPEREPGSVFAYNQPCTYALAAVLQRVTGRTVTEYLGPRLFEPLGITTGGWSQDPPGQDLGFTGLHLTTEAVARFGQTLLDDGVYAGRRVIPEGWVATATSLKVTTAGSEGSEAGEPKHDWAQGYGYQFWRARHGYRGDGAYGQFCLVLPEEDLVVATTAATEDMQGLLDAVWEHLLPAAGAVPPAAPGTTSDAARALADRLGALALAVVPGEPVPSSAAGTYAATDAGSDEVGLGGVELVPAGQGWALRARVPGWTVDVGAAVGRWVVTEPADGGAPFAASLALGDDGVVTAEVALLQNSHRVRLRLDPATRDLSSCWITRPLGVAEPRSMQHPLVAAASV